MTQVIICSMSSGLDEMPRKDQRDVVKVLRVLAKCGRYSIFEATENQTIARMMDKICHEGCTIVKADGSRKDYGLLIRCTGGEYPWTNITLTEGGLLLLREHGEPN